MTTNKAWSLRAAGASCHPQRQLHGKFDFSSYPEYRRISTKALELPHVREFVVDLSDVDCLDSSAPGMLLNFNESIAPKGGRPVLEKARGLAAQILKIASFDKIVGVR